MKSNHRTREAEVMSETVGRFIELVDASTVANVSGWRISRSGYGLLKQLASDPRGYPAELLNALDATRARRVKINAAREVIRRSVQIRNGPLLTVLYTLLAVLIALMTSGGIESVLVSGANVFLGVVILVSFVVLWLLALAMRWVAPYLTLLDALDDSLDRYSRRRIWRRQSSR